MPRYFLDRSLGGVKVPRLLRSAGWDILTMHEHYGKGRAQNVDDVTWISELTQLGFALLTADTRIVRNSIETQAIFEARAIVFILPQGDMTSEQMAARFDSHRVAIDDKVQRPGPAGFVVFPGNVSLVFP